MTLLLPALAQIAGWIVLSSLFSGYETAYYSVNRVRLRFLLQDGDPDAKRVQNFLNKPGFFIATLLIGNNITVYYTSAAVQNMVDAGFGWAGEFGLVVLTALIGTPFILVFSEMVPKTVYRARADQLALQLSRTLLWFERLFLPVTLFLSGYIRLVEKIIGGESVRQQEKLDRAAFQGILAESHVEGVLSESQNRLLGNLFQYDSLTLADCMIPAADVVTLPADATREQFVALARTSAFVRYPVAGGGGVPQGYINLYEILQADGDWNLQRHLHPMVEMNAGLKIVDAISALHRQGNSMGLVRDEQSQFMGIVTLKDLVSRTVRLK